MSNWDNATLQKKWNLVCQSTNKPITLDEKDIKSSFGGEGIIYLKNNTVYKVYPEDKFLPPEKKLKELQKLKHPSIIAPTDILVDGLSKRLKGYSMPYKDAYELCMLFPKAFKDRHKISPAQITDLVKLMQNANKYLHSMNFLMVDGNEMNYLVDKSFKNVYLIDVNSYQTPSYPAQAIMDSVKDPHAKSFSQNTDWYSWAIVTFTLFVGIHPYKGIYKKKNMTMTERMKSNISVFNKDVTIPAVCAPFDIIPQALRDWYEAVFEKGVRTAPPDSYESRIISTSRVTKQIGSDNFNIALLYTYQKPIVMYKSGYTMTENGLYQKDKVLVGLHDVAELAITGAKQGVLTRLEKGKVKFFNVMTKLEIPSQFQANEIMSYQGRVYLRNGSHINEVLFTELGCKTIPTLKNVGNVIESDTHMYEGCVVSILSNICNVSVFPKTETGYHIQIPELASYKVLDAKFDNGVLIIIAANTSGEHDKFIIRFDTAFKSYDVRIQKSIDVSDINFVVLDTGIVLHMTDQGVLECFKASPGAKDIIEIEDQAIDTDCILIKDGNQAMFARGEKIYKFSMKQAKSSTTNTGKKKLARDKNTGKIMDTTENQVAKYLSHKYLVDKDDVLINAILGITNTTSGMI